MNRIWLMVLCGVLAVPATTSLADSVGSTVTFLPGDFDQDGDVDAFDLGRWQSGFGKQNANVSEGDADSDGDVDAFDLGVWQANFGKPPASGGVPGGNAAPMPAAAWAGLALLAGLGITQRKR